MDIGKSQASSDEHLRDEVPRGPAGAEQLLRRVAP